MQQQVADLKKNVKEWADWKASSKDRHAKGREKSNKPDETIKEIFSLINQFGSYGAMGFGVGGGMDERNEDHKWVWDEFLRLDEELHAIRAKFLTEEEINKMETKNLKKVSPRHPRRSRGGRPRKK